jgi:hypothetical protein
MVPSFTNAFGSYSKTTNKPYTWKHKNGSTGSGVALVYEGYSRRLGPSKNPIVMVAGSPWRAPSTYHRSVSRISYKGTSSFTDGFYTYTDSWHTAGTQQNNIQGTLGTSGVSVSPVVCQMGVDTNAQNRARTEALLKLRDSKINVSQSLAEGKRTVNMVIDSASNLWKLLLAVKRGNLGYVTSYLGPKSIANGYLQWQYGWRPLCQDVKGAFDEAQKATRKGMFLTARRTVRDSPRLELNNSSFTGGGSFDCAYKCQLTARLTDPMLARANSIGLTNPLSLAWELVPFSFVVDWSLPVGNYLEALTATAGLTFVGGYESQRCTSTINATQVVPGFTGNMGSLEIEFFYFSRVALNGFPTPLPYVKSPFSTAHGASAIALLMQLLK